MNNRVLYAEDDSSVRQCITLALNHLGWDVTGAADGEAALQQLETGSFDLVITDHHMAGGDGLSLVRGLRERCFAGRILVISGGLDDAERDEYLRLGVDGVAAKPVTFSRLRALLAEVTAPGERALVEA